MTALIFLTVFIIMWIETSLDFHVELPREAVYMLICALFCAILIDIKPK